jgi:hypothetical protein
VWSTGALLGGGLSLAWFGAAWSWSDMALAAEAWGGIVAGCALVGTGLGLLVAPPAVPVGRDDADDEAHGAPAGDRDGAADEQAPIVAAGAGRSGPEAPAPTASRQWV